MRKSGIVSRTYLSTDITNFEGCQRSGKVGTVVVV